MRIVFILLISGLVIVLSALAYLAYTPTTPDKNRTDTLQNLDPGAPANQPRGIDPEHRRAALDPPPAAPQPANNDAARVIDLGQIENFDQASDVLDSIGMGEISELTRAWRQERGFLPPAGAASYSYLDDFNLRQFAENGDMWAQQTYASRIEPTRPADALDWYRRAAQNGSIYAIKQIERLYQKLSRVQGIQQSTASETLIQQRNALLNTENTPEQLSTAWSVVAQMAGADPTLNTALKSRLERNFSEDERAHICQIATSIYGDLSQSRTINNRGGFDRTPPPLISGSVKDLSQMPCANDNPTTSESGPDFSNCRELDLFSDGEQQHTILCNAPPE